MKPKTKRVKEYRKSFDAMMKNPMEQLDNLVKEANKIMCEHHAKEKKV